jgi:hypothetical protein
MDKIKEYIESRIYELNKNTKKWEKEVEIAENPILKESLRLNIHFAVGQIEELNKLYSFITENNSQNG